MNLTSEAKGMVRKRLSYVFLILSMSLFAQAIDENACKAAIDFQNVQYEVIYHSNFDPLKESYAKSVEDGVKAIRLLLDNYSKILHKEVSIAPREEYLLWKDTGIGVKLIISTFNESLLYFFPNDKNQIFVDGINFPVQTALLYGFIDLNNPKDEINLRKIFLKMPSDDAVSHYKTEEARISFTDSGGWFFIAGKGGLRFNNVHKMFSFREKTIVGVMTANLEITNSSQFFTQIHGHPDSFKFYLKGPLLFSSENTFSWAFEIASKLGREFAELEIKELFTKSEFFLLALADKKLRPKAEEIVQKKSRSEKDSSFQYPLWEFKKDVCELKKVAEQENINSSYVDELLACKALQPTDGHLLWYYPSPEGFMWQWLLVNCAVLIVLLLLRFVKYHNVPIFIHLIRRLPPLPGKISFFILILAANGWIFYEKPESVTLIYWIFPGAALLVSLFCCFNLTAIVQRYYDTTRISDV